MGRLIAAILPLLGVSCAEGGPVAVDAFYNLTCPASPAMCGSLAETCLGAGGLRQILGVNGEISCDLETPLVAICEATQRSDGGLLLTLVASVGDEFAFALRGATVDPNGSMVSGSCEITIIEDQLPYGGGNGRGRCGAEPPSTEQPCQISNVILGDADGADLSFDVECSTLLSGTTGRSFNVGDPEGGPATIRFARCSGF